MEIHEENKYYMSLCQTCKTVMETNDYKKFVITFLCQECQTENTKSNSKILALTKKYLMVNYLYYLYEKFKMDHKNPKFKQSFLSKIEKHLKSFDAVFFEDFKKVKSYLEPSLIRFDSSSSFQICSNIIATIIFFYFKNFFIFYFYFYFFIFKIF